MRTVRPPFLVRASSIAVGCLSIACIASAGSPPARTVHELKQLSLDELMQVNVTSVSKRSESIGEAVASIFVITAEDVRRGGATNLPEALRLAPSLQVARVTSSQYAISARGFNNAIGNKLLVLIDGRTVYTPLFSGVFWDQQDVMLEDVERIEVVSGPGATLWGANAVNGVINVITKSSVDTRGVVVAGGAGSAETHAAVRVGGSLGSSVCARVFAKHTRIEATETRAGDKIKDEWNVTRGGLRLDASGRMGEASLLLETYSGESEHRGIVGPFDLTPIEVAGTSVLVRWNRRVSSTSEVRVQAYYDHTERKDVIFYDPSADIYDLEAQHALTWKRNHTVWGGGIRAASDEIGPGIFTVFLPPKRDLAWQNVFVHNDLSLSERVDLGAGIRFERNDYTKWEFLPSVRLGWHPSPYQLVWGAVSRAVRAPSRLDRNVFFPGVPPYIVVGGPNFRSEIAYVYELGYRATPADLLSVSATVFLHDWSRLRSGTSIPVQLENKIEGTAHGVETWADYRPLRSWRLSGGFVLLRKDLRLLPGSTDPEGVDNPTLANDPDFQWNARSSFDLPARMELDVLLRDVGELPNPAVPGYTAVDVRLGWIPSPNVEVSVLGRNLFDRRHGEYGAAPSRSEFGRTLFAKVEWTWDEPE